MPKYIRRSLICLSIEDPQLGEKSYASWADAIILDFVKQSGRDWREDLKSRIPAAIHEAARGGAEFSTGLARWAIPIKPLDLGPWHGANRSQLAHGLSSLRGTTPAECLTHCAISAARVRN